ncbi:MAG: methyl-accepting chemotaxis protein [Deltaproteobacteria bacterium]|nr:methyl-accepting chemotaxis protein [Deltaproteobacteria bacterium]
MKWNVRSRLIGIIFASILITALVCTIFGFYNYAKLAREDLEKRMKMYADPIIKTINEVNTLGGKIGESAVVANMIEKECDKMMKGYESDISYIVVTDEHGKTFYNPDKTKLGSAHVASSDYLEIKLPISENNNPGFVCVGVKKDKVYQKAKAFVYMNVVLSLLLIALIIPASYALVSRNVIYPLKRITLALTDIAEGERDLTKRLQKIETGDEFETLSKKFNKFVDHIQEIVLKVDELTEGVSKTSSDLYAKAEEMKNIMKTQSEKTVNVAAAVEEMTASVLEVAKGAEFAKEESIRSSKIAKNGEEMTRESVEIMGRLKETVQNSSNTVNELGKLSDLIDEIIKVIEDIADQTNLLALNAAIEAARAGEAGRGFAVVADEVRKLAEKTVLAAKDIGKTVMSIKDGIVNTVGSMERIKKEVEISASKTKEVQNILNEIVKGSEHVMGLVTQIATASSQQSLAAEEINRNVEEIKQSIMRTSEGIEHHVKLVAGLNNLVIGLKEYLGSFKF